MTKCPDYDEDCVQVEDPFNCWMGHPEGFMGDTLMYTPALPVAGGYCPLVKATENEKEHEAAK